MKEDKEVKMLLVLVVVVVTAALWGGWVEVQCSFHPQFPPVGRHWVDVCGCARAIVFHACPWTPINHFLH
ncbi:hypothetical protein E2C01_098976 [Portunus trituberculatus]|uniref:Uncharacterized protein n=1 Tax=Portunus trituberculatus TaxID=210409 RepID=A0A5B7K4A5_PORTR|nr:hypothetical protein [Portunus trituberculatus]